MVNDVLLIICLAVMLISAVYAVMADSTFKAAIGLACSSVFLGILMYAMGSTWAALFEISVCSGFVTVIFVSAVAMTSQTREEQDQLYDQKKHTKLLPLLMIIAGAVIIAVLAFSGFSLPDIVPAVQTEKAFGDVLWTQHKDLILALLMVLVVGAFAVIVLFREKDKEDGNEHI